MDDPGLVRRGQRVRNRARVSRGSRSRQRAPPRERRGQRLAVQVLHHDVGAAGRIDLAVEHLDDAGVRDRRRRARLQEKSLQQIGAADQLARQQLDRRFALQVPVLGQIHLAHRAAAQLSQDLVAADGLPDHAGDPRPFGKNAKVPWIAFLSRRPLVFFSG